MKIVVVGCGGHAKVVVDAALSAGIAAADLLGFVDDDPRRIGTEVMGMRVLSTLESLAQPGAVSLVMGIGDNAARRGQFERARALGYQVLTVIHPSAVVGRGCTFGPGTVVMANVVVNADTRIADNVILNTACSVDHDCRVESHVHVAPGARVAGGVTIGAGTLLGIGAVVIPGMSIGAGTIVGAGAVVTRDLAANCVAVGSPARVIKRRKETI